MAYQFVFERYELKYVLTRAQKEKILEAMAPYMKLDKFGRTTIRNIYYDTPCSRLIRKSIEKPTYKEKLRVRSYKQVGAEDTVFVELKKKHDSIVYKRRMSLPCRTAMGWLEGGQKPDESQIAKEIQYFLNYYRTLEPAVFLTYEREAFFSLDGSDFRVTFDDNILYRQEDLSLEAEVWGTPILGEDQVLMEIKCSGGIPLWMTEVLSREKIYKASYSKYGTAYKQIHTENRKRGKKYA